MPRRSSIPRPAQFQNQEHATLFDRVAAEMLHGDRELFDSLNDAERKVVLDYMAEVLTDGRVNNALYNVLWEMDYLRKPVDVETFLQDDSLFGRSCADFDPPLIEDMKRVFAPGSTISQLVMTGALGYGKTSVAMAAIGYVIYRMSCLRNPARYYGLLDGSKIVFGIYSITKRQAADAGYWRLRSYIDRSPYFQHTFPRDRRIETKIVFKSHNMEVVQGSRELHVVGLDMFTCALDEANFMSKKVDKETGKQIGQAYDLFNATANRITSRFLQKGGVIPGIVILMSSRNTQSDFLEVHLGKLTEGKYRAGMRGQISRNAYLIDYNLWENKPDKYSKQKFQVEVGDRYARTRILKRGEKPRPGAKVVSVPIDFYDRFLEDPEQQLRDIAGVATLSHSPLIHDVSSLYDAVRKHLKHPFTREELTITTEDDVMVQDFFNLKVCCSVVAGRWVPKVNPHAPRYVHIDSSLSGDCTGIVMLHPSGIIRVREPRLDGTYTSVVKMMAIVDFMLRIRPPRASQIDLSKIRSFVMYLGDLFPIKCVSLDGFQSADSMQIMRKAGIDAVLLSVDRDDAAYMGLRSAFFERRLVYYRYEPVINELLELERDVRKGRVDHPERSALTGGAGSKDVADGLAGSYALCLRDEDSWRALPFLSSDSGCIIDPSVPIELAPPQLVTGNGEVKRPVNWAALEANLLKR
jgi:hypothetical protein